MSFLDQAADKNITRLVRQYTGEFFVPEFRTPCRSSISSDWDGWVGLDSKSIWLVNKYGARGVPLENLTLSELSGQYSPESRGYPLYSFTFNFQGMGSFSVHPKTKSGGEELSAYLKRYLK